MQLHRGTWRFAVESEVHPCCMRIGDGPLCPCGGGDFFFLFPIIVKKTFLLSARRFSAFSKKPPCSLQETAPKKYPTILCNVSKDKSPSIQYYFAKYPCFVFRLILLAAFSFVNGFGWQRCESHTESVVTCLGIVLLWLTLQPILGGGACCPGLSGYVLFGCFCLASGRVSLVVRSLKHIPCAIVRLFPERQKLSPVFLY